MCSVRACLLWAIAYSSYAANDFESDHRGSCAASSNPDDGRTAALLQVADQRNSLRASAHQPSEVEPEAQVEWSGLEFWTWKERQELMCYLKKELQQKFKKSLTPMKGSPPFREDLSAKKCAFVSNSGAMLNHSYGSAIDSADAVFRVNDARVRGFEEYVGSRETVRILWHPVDFVHDSWIHFDEELKPNVSYLIMTPNSTVQDLLREKYPESLFYLFPFSLYGATGRALEKVYNSSNERWLNTSGKHTPLATTGSIAMLFALSFCGEVEAFEMAPSAHAYKDAAYNYFGQHLGSPSASINKVHGWFQAEHDLWRRLSANTATDIFNTGRAVVRGFDAVDCETNGSHTPEISFTADTHGRTSGTETGSGEKLASFSRWTAPPTIGDLPALKIPNSVTFIGQPGATVEESGSTMYSTPVICVMSALLLLLPVAILYCYTKWQGKMSAYSLENVDMAAVTSLAIYIALLLSCDILISYLAQSHNGSYPWDPSFIVFVVEISKLTVSLIMVYAKSGSAPTSAEVERSSDLPEESLLSLAGGAALRLLPVAAIYAGNNSLAYVVLAEVQIDAYVVWRNTTIFFNAFLWTAIRGRVLQEHQWTAVAFLTLGCSLKSFEANGSLSNVIGIPVLIVLMTAFLSALAAVLSEAVLHAERFKKLGIDGLNCLLYGPTSVLLLTWLFGCAAFHGRPLLAELPRLAAELDSSAFAIVSMQVSLGISVSRVLAYSNSVAKTMAGGAREVLQVAIAPFFVSSKLDGISILSVLWISTAMLTYASPPSGK